MMLGGWWRNVMNGRRDRNTAQRRERDAEKREMHARLQLAERRIAAIKDAMGAEQRRRHA